MQMLNKNLVQMLCNTIYFTSADFFTFLCNILNLEITTLRKGVINNKFSTRFFDFKLTHGQNNFRQTFKDFLGEIKLLRSCFPANFR